MNIDMMIEWEVDFIATQCNTYCIPSMQESVTTSVRLPRELRRQVELKAASNGCGRNRVIIKALESYLREDEQAAYETEARHQSLMAAMLDAPDSAWDQMVERDFPSA